MARLWLPTRQRPFTNPQTEREHLMNELYDLRYMVPGAMELEIQQLRDIVQACRQKAKAADEKEAKAAQAIIQRMEPKQVGKVLKDFIAQKRKEQAARRI